MVRLYFGVKCLNEIDGPGVSVESDHVTVPRVVFCVLDRATKNLKSSTGCSLGTLVKSPRGGRKERKILKRK